MNNPKSLSSKFALAISVNNNYSYIQLRATNKLDACVESAFIAGKEKYADNAHILMRTYPHEYKSIYKINLITCKVTKTGCEWF